MSLKNAEFLEILHLQAFKISCSANVSMKKFYNFGSRPWNYEGLFARKCHLGLHRISPSMHDPMFQSQGSYRWEKTKFPDISLTQI